MVIRRTLVPLILLGLCTTASAGVREQVELSGEWRFQLDPGKLGIDEDWPSEGVPAPGPIDVPGCWEAQGYGAETSDARHEFTGWGWYERTFRVPGRWRRDGSVMMHLGPVHRSAKVWVNGRLVHEKLGYVTASEFAIADALAWGEPNTLTVLVDSEQHTDIDGLAGCYDTYDFIKWGGIYGHCWLELRHEPHVRGLFVHAEDDCQAARVTAHLAGAVSPQAGYSARCLISATDRSQRYAGDGPVTIAGEGSPHIDLRLPIPQARLWSPEDPHLYDVTLELLREAQVVDRVATRTGFREIEVRGNDIYLNGHRTFLRGYGDDACFPLTVAPPADKGFWLRRFRVAKRYGFLFVRHHSHVPVQEYFDAADEIGMLVQPELPIAYEQHIRNATDAARQLFAAEWREMILQYRNHPSLMIWCMGNEAWNSHALAQDLYRVAYELDGTRPVCDTDGVPRAPYAEGKTRDTLDIHHVQFDEQTIPWGPNKTKYRLTGPPARPVTVHEMGNFVAFYDVRDARRYTGLTRPSWLVGNPRPAPVSYRSHREANARLYVVRQLGEPWMVEWRTAAVPDPPGRRVTFAFTAATGWTTEPSGHFTLHLNGRPLLRFNLPETAPAVWRSDDGTAELTFDVRESGIDQFGVMCLSVDAGWLEPGEPARLKVTGSASGSRRWFGLYDYTDTLTYERGKLPADEAAATLVNGYAGLVRWVSGDTGSVAGVARLGGTTDQLPEFVEHSQKLQALCRKLNTEAARRSPEIDGYTLWLLQDYWKGGQGLLNQFYEPKGVSAEDSLTRNAETVVLLDRDRCALRGGSRLEATAVVSHFGASPLNDPVVDVSLLDDAGHAVYRRRRHLDEVPSGTVADVADLRLPFPDLPEPARYRLQLDLTGGKCQASNVWDFWAFPEPAPVPGIRHVAAVSGAWLEQLYPGIYTLTHGEPLPEGVDTVVVGALSRNVLDALAAGRRVLLLSTDAFIGDRLRFKSPWWFPQPQDSNLGTIVRHHPALGDFPHEGWCDLVWFDMVEGCQAIHHQGGLSRVRPIIQAIDLPLRQLTRSLVFEARVGEGRLLACSLNLTSQVLGRDPAARHLLDCLLRYMQSDRFALAAKLTPEELRQAVAASGLLDSTLIEGFARIVAAAPDPHSGQTETYGPPELSVRGERVTSWFARERDDTRFVTWQTASAPAAVDTPTVTFVWTGVLGWKDEPEGVLRLHIGETPVVDFDVTDQPGEWTSADGQVRLRFSPGARNGSDTLGTFALELPAGQVEPGKPLTLTVRAYGGSRRWFAVQEYTNTLDWLFGLR